MTIKGGIALALSGCLAGFGVAAAIGLWNTRGPEPGGEPARIAEAQALENTAGALVAVRAELAEVRKKAEKIDGLSDAIKAALRVSPKSKPESVCQFRSEPIPVALPSLLPDGWPGSDPDSTPSIDFEVAGSEVRFKTEAGNTWAEGEVELWRSRPLPMTLLGRKPWKSKASTLVVPNPVPDYRPPWEFGPAIGADADGSMLGATVLTPPFRLWRVSAHGSGLILFHADGRPVVAATITAGLPSREKF